MKVPRGVVADEPDNDISVGIADDYRLCVAHEHLEVTTYGQCLHIPLPALTRVYEYHEHLDSFIMLEREAIINIIIMRINGEVVVS